jgi:hypothetical protein
MEIIETNDILNAAWNNYVKRSNSLETSPLGTSNSAGRTLGNLMVVLQL